MKKRVFKSSRMKKLKSKILTNHLLLVFRELAKCIVAGFPNLALSNQMATFWKFYQYMRIKMNELEFYHINYFVAISIRQQPMPQMSTAVS